MLPRGESNDAKRRSRNGSRCEGRRKSRADGSGRWYNGIISPVACWGSRPMLTIQGPARRLCGGPTRRDFLRLGALGGLALATPRAAEAGASFGRAKRCLLLFLTGGPPQHDTFDPKPDAPAGSAASSSRSPPTSPASSFSELFPRLARAADKFCVVRSVTHGDRTHTSAGYTMLTGVPHPKANAESASDDPPQVRATTRTSARCWRKLRPPGDSPDVRLAARGHQGRRRQRVPRPGRRVPRQGASTRSASRRTLSGPRSGCPTSSCRPT